MIRGPDIIASVRFYSTGEGGRRQTTPAKLFKCLLEFEGEKFYCGLHLEANGPLAPGSTATVPITLLIPDGVKRRLKVGSLFTLWEVRTIARGIVSEILSN
jgi:hypothetical protein